MHRKKKSNEAEIRWEWEMRPVQAACHYQQSKKQLKKSAVKTAKVMRQLLACGEKRMSNLTFPPVCLEGGRNKINLNLQPR